MTRITNTIRITRPIEEVFAFVTTPANWPTWHLASLSIAGNVDHSLLVGEEVIEEFRAAGRRGRATWRVTRRDVPQLWTIETSAQGGRATIVYRLRADRGETLFERELTYAMPSLWLALLDVILLRRRMRRESRAALQRLKEVLEMAVSQGRTRPTEPTLAR